MSQKEEGWFKWGVNRLSSLGQHYKLLQKVVNSPGATILSVASSALKYQSQLLSLNLLQTLKQNLITVLQTVVLFSVLLKYQRSVRSLRTSLKSKDFGPLHHPFFLLPQSKANITIYNGPKGSGKSNLFKFYATQQSKKRASFYFDFSSRPNPSALYQFQPQLGTIFSLFSKRFTECKPTWSTLYSHIAQAQARVHFYYKHRLLCMLGYTGFNYLLFLNSTAYDLPVMFSFMHLSLAVWFALPFLSKLHSQRPLMVIDGIDQLLRKDNDKQVAQFIQNLTGLSKSNDLKLITSLAQSQQYFKNKLVPKVNPNSTKRFQNSHRIRRLTGWQERAFQSGQRWVNIPSGRGDQLGPELGKGQIRQN